MSEGNAKRHTIQSLRRLIISIRFNRKRFIKRLFDQHMFEQAIGPAHMQASRQALKRAMGLSSSAARAS